MGWEEWEAPAHPARCCRGVRSQKNQPSDVSATSSTSGWALSNHKSSVKGLVNVTPLLTLMTSSTYPPLWLLCHLTWFLPLPLLRTPVLPSRVDLPLGASSQASPSHPKTASFPSSIHCAMFFFFRNFQMTHQQKSRVLK